VLVALDLLYLNRRDLRNLPLIQRRAELSKIVDSIDVQFSESFEIEGREMFAHACKLDLEGVVSKVRDGPSPKGRTSDRVKKTCSQRETIAGFALGEGRHLCRPAQGRRSDLCGQGRSWLRKDVCRHLQKKSSR
jgi:bifunctional non-homologous end joining protein LigD